MSSTLDELRRTREVARKAEDKLRQVTKLYRRILDLALKAYINASARLLRLEKVRKKIRLKEYRLVE